MKMIRFKTDITNNDGIVWKRGNLYRVLSEEEEQITLESDAIDNEVYSIQRADLNTYCCVYICDGNININCNYCKFLQTNKQEKFCEQVKRSESDE